MNYDSFEDRSQAGEFLAERIRWEAGRVDCVIGIPRGGLVVAAPVARVCGCPLGAVFVAKIRHPLQPEFAIGAVDEGGRAYIDAMSAADLPHEIVAQAVRRAQRVVAERKKLYGPFLPRLSPRGLRLVVVDDGLATGESCRAALRYLRGLAPARLVLGVPCASTSGFELVQGECDQVISLIPPDSYFMAVGDYYREFGQTSDDEAMRALGEANSPSRAA